MPVVIDGNNLLHAARKRDSTQLLIGPSMLCDKVGSWARRCGERVRVVFDGPVPSAARAAQIGHPAIEVLFSGSGVSADAVVIGIVEHDSAARRLLVVSSDRAIQRAAKRRRARTIAADAFWVALLRVLERPEGKQRREPEEKEAGLGPAATAEWLAEFGLE